MTELEKALQRWLFLVTLCKKASIHPVIQYGKKLIAFLLRDEIYARDVLLDTYRPPAVEAQKTQHGANTWVTFLIGAQTFTNNHTGR